MQASCRLCAIIRSAVIRCSTTARLQSALAIALALSLGCASPAWTQRLYKKYENECVERGWRKDTMKVDGTERHFLWKAPVGTWKGAIVALHGGGGANSNYCANIPLGRPMVNFGDMALAEGFALFAPDSEMTRLRDAAGNPCGKRWNSLYGGGADNSDVRFIEEIATKTIPRLRPPDSSVAIFITGVSNGGFLTILAATRLGGAITAFAPVSAGDPYATRLDCRKELTPLRPNTPGIFFDDQSKRSIAEQGACQIPKGMKLALVDSPPGRKPPFKFFYDEGDGGVDASCKVKAITRLVANGYPDMGSFVVKSSSRGVLKHFWLEDYNRPLIDFLKSQSTQPAR